MRILARFEGARRPFAHSVFGNGQGLLLLVHSYRAFFRQGRMIGKIRARLVVIAGVE